MYLRTELLDRLETVRKRLLLAFISVLKCSDFYVESGYATRFSYYLGKTIKNSKTKSKS